MLVVTNYLLHVSTTHNKQTEPAANLGVVLQPCISEYTGLIANTNITMHVIHIQVVICRLGIWLLSMCIVACTCVKLYLALMDV